MFNKKKKDRPEISAPDHFEHRVHTGYDAVEGKFVGLPMQWAGVINPPSTTRPKPIIDASFVTQTDMHNTKVSLYSDHIISTISKHISIDHVCAWSPELYFLYGIHFLLIILYRTTVYYWQF